jgi:Na+/phosphate symporter
MLEDQLQPQQLQQPQPQQPEIPDLNIQSEKIQKFIETEKKIRTIEQLQKIAIKLDKISNKISRYIVINEKKLSDEEKKRLMEISTLLSELSDLIKDFLEIAPNLELNEILAFKENVIFPIINSIEV